jgi:hypothetical protein
MSFFGHPSATTARSAVVAGRKKVPTSGSTYILTLKMEAVGTSQKLVTTYQIARCYSTEDRSKKPKFDTCDVIVQYTEHEG